MHPPLVTVAIERAGTVETAAVVEQLRDMQLDEFFAKPSAIADTVYHVVHQDRSAWTFNVDVRPYHENW